jgi:(p)ppGpp synthase/HD superfamily hydrolase
MENIARNFAIKHHSDQLYGIHPYIAHLDAVAAIVRPFGQDAIVVALLHDVVEDTSVTVADIENIFGKFVSDCVAILSDEDGKDRLERKEKTYAKMAAVTGVTELALIVKVADRLANVTACINDCNEQKLGVYRNEKKVFCKSVYREGLCDELWCDLNRML